eukprot:3882894-Pleurochrysis_carterae.AAC.1
MSSILSSTPSRQLSQSRCLSRTSVTLKSSLSARFALPVMAATRLSCVLLSPASSRIIAIAAIIAAVIIVTFDAASASTCSDTACALATDVAATARQGLLQSCLLRHPARVGACARQATAAAARMWPRVLPTLMVCSSPRRYEAAATTMASADAVRRQPRTNGIVALSFLRRATRSVRTYVSPVALFATQEEPSALSSARAH